MSRDKIARDILEEEWEKVLGCAREGVLLPKPCLACNGMFQHRDYCPHRHHRTNTFGGKMHNDGYIHMRTSIGGDTYRALCNAGENFVPSDSEGIIVNFDDHWSHVTCPDCKALR